MIRVQSLRSSLAGKVNNMTSSIQSSFAKIEQKAEGTFAENWVKFWKNVFTDYKEVTIDLINDLKGKPLKASATVAVSAFVAYMFKHNPSETDYRSAVVRAANDIRLVSPSMQKTEAVEFLRKIEECYNKDLMRHLNLGIVCIIWIDKYNKLYKSEEAMNKHLKITYREFFDSILDIGLLDHWLILPKKMEDYDINY